MNELTKMNLIAIVQQLPKEDIEFVQTYITILEDKLQQKENIIKEVREYIENKDNQTKRGIYPNYWYEIKVKDILEILDKLNKGE